MRTSVGNKLSRGFTLLEMLAAMGILAVVLGMATLALNQFQAYGRAEGANFKTSLEDTLRLNQLADLIEASFDYYVENARGDTLLLFQGESDELVFVSQRNWFQPGIESFNRLRVRPSVSDPALSALVLYTVGLDTNPLLRDDRLPDTDDMAVEVVLDQCESIEFEYLGIQSIRSMLAQGVERNVYRTLDWSSDYNGSETQFLPAKIRIAVTRENGLQQSFIVELPIMNLAKRSLMVGG